ncbi:hypothetical protein PCE1_000436 [Barthelona sp. PCE]
MEPSSSMSISGNNFVFEPIPSATTVDGPYDFKVLFAGSMAVGKTSILRCLNNLPFNLHYKSTVCYDSLWFDGNIPDIGNCPVCVYDMAGQLRYASDAGSEDSMSENNGAQNLPLLFREASLLVCVFDIQQSQTFRDLRFWINQFKNTSVFEELPPVLIVINKLDMVDMSQEELQEYTDNCMDEYESAACIGVSARSGYNIDELRKLIVNNLHERFGRPTEATVTDLDEEDIGCSC